MNKNEWVPGARCKIACGRRLQAHESLREIHKPLKLWFAVSAHKKKHADLHPCKIRLVENRCSNTQRKKLILAQF